MRRVARMSFAPGMYVFPGGSLDSSDRDITCPIVGEPDQRGVRSDPDLARGLLVCAVRETFEETGVLLASGARWREACQEEHRIEIEGGRRFAELLVTHDLVIDAQRIPMWSHWVTPDIRPQRFDVRFYVAVLPSDAVADDISGESDHASWIPPVDALALHASGEMRMMTPTVATLREIAEYSCVAAVMAEAPRRVLQP